jgi:hypothetical protein
MSKKKAKTAKQRSAPIVPTKVTDVFLAFPADVTNMMPKWEAIPDEFKRGSTMWNRFFNDMFHVGIKNVEMSPKTGIDPKLAFRHIKAISGSFQPKHEHKEAAVSYLLSQWFEDAKWERDQ